MKYKFTRIYLVDAATEVEGFRKCKDEPSKHLTFSSVAVESSEPRPTWRAAVKKQVTGK